MCLWAPVFYTNVNAWVYTCVCDRACVHKVPPCKCLIVCVGNNSPIPQGMKQAWKRSGPQTSGGPPGHGTPRRTPPQGQPRPPPRKGRGEPEGVTSDSHSVDAPGCRGGKPAGSTGSRPHQGRPGPGPGDQRPPTPQSGPARPVGPGPAKRPPKVGRRSPEHPAPARETTNAPAASSTGRAWWWGGGRLRWWVRWSLRPDLTHRRRRTSTHIHKQTFPPSCTQMNIHTLAPHVDTQKWTRYPHHTPHMHSILLDPGTTTPRGVVSARSRSWTPFAPARGQEDHPGPRSSRENQQPRPRPGGQLILTAPAPDREQRTGVWERKKRPHASPHPLKCSVGVCCSKVL